MVVWNSHVRLLLSLVNIPIHARFVCHKTSDFYQVLASHEFDFLRPICSVGFVRFLIPAYL